MTKQEFVLKLYEELKKDQDVQKIAKSIKTAEKNNRFLTVNEQLEIVALIRQEHKERTRRIFESVDVFLSLVNQVEKQIEAQNKMNSEGENDANQ